MAAESIELEQAPPRGNALITRRLVWSLGAVALGQALVVSAAALGAPAWLPGGAALQPAVLPGLLAGTAVALALLLAPAWGEAAHAHETRRAFLIRAGFVGCWQAAACAYFLLIASRMTPVDAGGLTRASASVGLCAMLAVLLAGCWPRAYPGVALFWAVGAPMGAYLVAELFRSTPPGYMGWSANPSAEAATLRTWVDALLRVSPGTATVGQLEGQLPGGAPMGWAQVGVFGLAGGAVAFLALRFTPPRADQ